MGSAAVSLEEAREAIGTATKPDDRRKPTLGFYPILPSRPT